MTAAGSRQIRDFPLGICDLGRHPWSVLPSLLLSTNHLPARRVNLPVGSLYDALLYSPTTEVSKGFLRLRGYGGFHTFPKVAKAWESCGKLRKILEISTLGNTWKPSKRDLRKHEYTCGIPRVSRSRSKTLVSPQTVANPWKPPDGDCRGALWCQKKKWVGRTVDPKGPDGTLTFSARARL
jgi:hypothetical protein